VKSETLLLLAIPLASTSTGSSVHQSNATGKRFQPRKAYDSVSLDFDWELVVNAGCELWCCKLAITSILLPAVDMQHRREMVA